MILTFEEWERQQDPEQPADEEAAWNAGRMSRDAEIADLQRQLREQEAAMQIVRRNAKVCFSRDQGEPNPTPAFATHVEVPISDWYDFTAIETRALDAYVQEKVDRAVLAESEKSGCTNATCPYCTWERAKLDERLAANKAKVGEGK